MTKIINFLRNMLDLLVPRILKEKVCLNFIDGEWVPLFPFSTLKDDDVYEATGYITGLNVFGLMLFPMLDTTTIEYVNK